jgi:prepilin-type N-terminal cleavage/methylation domain-containing protein
VRIMKGLRKYVRLSRLADGERGFAMVEVLVALALIGLAGVCFLSSLNTVCESTITADVQGTADSLAASQMEYVLSQDYDDTANPPQYDFLSDIPENWSVSVKAERLDPENDSTDDDDGIQEIFVAVDYGIERVVTLTSRKVNMNYVP